MSRPRPTKCRSCGASIYWAYTVDGNRMPVDADPVDEGNVIMAVNRRTGELRARVVSPDEHVPNGRNRYTPHFATCPDAEGWRSD